MTIFLVIHKVVWQGVSVETNNPETDMLKNPTEYAAELATMFDGDKAAALNAFKASVPTWPHKMPEEWVNEVTEALS